MKKILILTPFFSPNVGGVETYLTDLCKILKTIHNVSEAEIERLVFARGKRIGGRYEVVNPKGAGGMGAEGAEGPDRAGAWFWTCVGD